MLERFEQHQSAARKLREARAECLAAREELERLDKRKAELERLLDANEVTVREETAKRCRLEDPAPPVEV